MNQKQRRTAQIQLAKFDASRINISHTLDEIRATKEQIDRVRQELNSFLTQFASVPDSCEEEAFYHAAAKKMFDLRELLEIHLNRYNNLLPIIELARQANGFASQKFEIVTLHTVVSGKSYSKALPKKLLSQNSRPKITASANSFKAPGNKIMKHGNNGGQMGTNPKSFTVNASSPTQPIVL